MSYRKTDYHGVAPILTAKHRTATTLFPSIIGQSREDDDIRLGDEEISLGKIAVENIFPFIFRRILRLKIKNKYFYLSKIPIFNSFGEISWSKTVDSRSNFEFSSNLTTREIPAELLGYRDRRGRKTRGREREREKWVKNGEERVEVCAKRRGGDGATDRMMN